MKLSYEYKVEKIAFLNDGKELVPVGICEHDSRVGDTIKMTVKLYKHLPKQLVDLLKENPQVLSIKEVKRKCDTVIILPEGDDNLILPNS